MSGEFRVLIVSPYFQPAWGYGGPVRSVWNLARGLALAGANVDVATTDADPSGNVDVPPYRLEEGVSIHTFRRVFRRMPKLKTLYYAPGLKPFLEESISKADIVNAQGLYVWPTLLSSRKCAFHKVPFVISLRGSLGKWGLRQKALKKKIYLALIEKRTIDLSSALHYTLKAEYAEAPGWVKKIPPVLEPNGVEFGPLYDGMEWRKKFGLHPDDIVVGMIGRIHPKKGIRVLIDALSRIPLDKAIRLVIVGGGEAHDVEDIRAHVVRLGLSHRVTIIGMLHGKDILEAYSAIDLLALPSQEENFGNVIIEALAQNTPVAVSPHVGLASWVTEQKVGDVIPSDPGVWASYLMEVPRKRQGVLRNLRSIAQAYFDYRVVGERMLRMYRKIASGHESATACD